MPGQPANTALGDLRVLDLSTRWGMYASKLLADLGADVIKIEPPPGCEQRYRGPFLSDQPDINRSAFFWYHNTNKRGITLDFELPAEQRTFLELVRTADVLIEGHPPGYLAALGLGYDDLSVVNPGLIFTSVTPFGQTGPYMNYLADDIVLGAMGGLMFLCGMPESPPSQPAGASGIASIMQGEVAAAVGTLMALVERDSSGLGQSVDVSIQEAVATCNENALGYHAVMNIVRRRTGLGNMSVTGANSTTATGRMLRPTADGWISGGTGPGLTFDAACAWMAALEVEPPDWLTSEWFESTDRFARGGKINEFLEDVYKSRRSEDLFHLGQSRRNPIGPVRTAQGVAEDQQFAARGFFVDVLHPELGRSIRYPGAPYRLSETPWRIERTAPQLGEHDSEFRNGQETWLRPRESAQIAADTERKRPLEGLVVVDFTWQLAGPMATKYMAAFGATVIKVESSKKLDFPRTVFPRPPGSTSVNASHIFANFNTDKYSVTIDLSTRKGQEVVLELIRKADVVIDNFGVDPMPKWGLSYQDIRRANPNVIVLRSSVYGRSGPNQNYSGTGYIIAAASGLNMLMGFPSDPPVGTCIAHPDYGPNPFHSLVAILSALHYRRRTGKGQYIDLSQMESSAAFWGHALMEWTVNENLPPRIGNRSPWVAPHGAYRTAAVGDDTDQWIALACTVESQWEALAQALGPEWLGDPRFATNGLRLKHAAELDDLIASAVASWNGHELMRRLQSVGVPAGVVQNAKQLLEEDPHLRARGFYTWIEHPELGTIPHDGIPALLSATPAKITNRAPLLGEHTSFVLREFLSLTDEQIAELTVAGVLE